MRKIGVRGFLGNCHSSSAAAIAKFRPPCQPITYLFYVISGDRGYMGRGYWGYRRLKYSARGRCSDGGILRLSWMDAPESRGAVVNWGSRRTCRYSGREIKAGETRRNVARAMTTSRKIST